MAFFCLEMNCHPFSLLPSSWQGVPFCKAQSQPFCRANKKTYKSALLQGQKLGPLSASWTTVCSYAAPHAAWYLAFSIFACSFVACLCLQCQPFGKALQALLQGLCASPFARPSPFARHHATSLYNVPASFVWVPIVPATIEVIVFPPWPANIAVGGPPALFP